MRLFLTAAFLFFSLTGISQDSVAITVPGTSDQKKMDATHTDSMEAREIKESIDYNTAVLERLQSENRARENKKLAVRIILGICFFVLLGIGLLRRKK